VNIKTLKSPLKKVTINPSNYKLNNLLGTYTILCSIAGNRRALKNAKL
jgi:hypothetical protein